MRRLCFTLLIAAFMAAFFMRPAQAQNWCFPDMKSAVTEVSKHGEIFRYSVVMKIGALLHFYASENTMTILIENPNGTVCTGPALIGDVLRFEQDTCV
tara:strand:+ start:281 stop:574 length:294 start_codon:yes stop_codon:yes gene_type:complete